MLLINESVAVLLLRTASLKIVKARLRMNECLLDYFAVLVQSYMQGSVKLPFPDLVTFVLLLSKCLPLLPVKKETNIGRFQDNL